jgi:hypothetical protein
MFTEDNRPHVEPSVKLPDEVWSRLLNTGRVSPFGLLASVRLLDGRIINKVLISNRGYILGPMAPGLAGAHGSFDSSVLTFATKDIEGVLAHRRHFWQRDMWVCLNPQHPARREYEKAMKYPEELVTKTADLILSKFSVSPDRARRLAVAAMNGMDSHGSDPHDWGTIEQVVEIVVRSWVDKGLVL